MNSETDRDGDLVNGTDEAGGRRAADRAFPDDGTTAARAAEDPREAEDRGAGTPAPGVPAAGNREPTPRGPGDEKPGDDESGSAEPGARVPGGDPGGPEPGVAAEAAEPGAPAGDHGRAGGTGDLPGTPDADTGTDTDTDTDTDVYTNRDESTGTGAGTAKTDEGTTGTAGRKPRRRRTDPVFDPMALVAGLFFAGIAIAHLLTAGGVVEAHADDTLAAAAVGIGLSVLAGLVWKAVTAARTRRPMDPKA